MSPPELSRRAALTGVVFGLAVAGCDLQARETPPTGTPTAVAPTGTPGSEAAAPEDPDEALVESVRADIAAALALVTAGAGRPALRAELGDWRRLHRLHLDAVPGEDAGEDAGEQQATAVGSVAQVRRRVRREEARLQRTLADAALAAESGPLAALLASMSAGIAQLLAATGGGR
ncbi:hypothetical protein [Nocardioides coralli]|uniref:hypothetical protein n=1 Tax=Nocardioides coralli TaxID=2872154 RepID=UPI0020172676|nr:hypothetical protein [Nocardioides coralli]